MFCFNQRSLDASLPAEWGGFSDDYLASTAKGHLQISKLACALTEAAEVVFSLSYCIAIKPFGHVGIAEPLPRESNSRRPMSRT